MEEVGTAAEIDTVLAEAEDFTPAAQVVLDPVVEANRVLDLPKRQRVDAAAALVADTRFVAALRAGGDGAVRVVGAKLAEYGQGPRALRSLLAASAPQREDDGTGADNTGRYVISEDDPGCWYLVEANGNYTKLCNFTARVDEYIRRDNGDGVQELTYRISGSLSDGRELPSIDVAAEDFRGMGWLYRWGPGVWLGGKKGTESHIRSAIMQVSTYAPVRTVYTHIGWRQIAGKWVYLTPAGAVGNVDAVVEVRGFDSRFELAVEGDPVEAVKASLLTLYLGKAEVTFPVASAVYVSPFFGPLDIDFLIWVYGRSGSLKTSLGRVQMAHFGKGYMSGKVVASWINGTGNALERKAHDYRDAMPLIDNYVPRANPAVVVYADRFIQSIGDRAGRERLNRNSEAMPSPAPKGICLSTAEDMPPPGESTLARCVLVPIRQGDIREDRLAHVQQMARNGVLSRAHRAYIEWIAADYEERAAWVSSRRKELDAEIRAKLPPGYHGRTPENLGRLAVGLACYLRFAQEVSAIDDVTAKRVLEQGVQAFVTLGSQAATHSETRFSTRYIETLCTLLAQGRVRLAPDDEPLAEHTDGAGRAIGWVSDDEVLILPDAAWDEIRRFVGQDEWRTTKEQVYRLLREEGHLQPGDVERRGERTVERRTQFRPTGGGRHRVLVFPLSLFADSMPTPKAPPPDPTDEELDEVWDELDPH